MPLVSLMDRSILQQKRRKPEAEAKGVCDINVGKSLARRTDSQNSSHRLLIWQQRRAIMVLVPLTVQCMPDSFGHCVGMRFFVFQVSVSAGII
jgi:hypothetical protein